MINWYLAVFLSITPLFVEGRPQSSFDEGRCIDFQAHPGLKFDHGAVRCTSSSCLLAFDPMPETCASLDRTPQVNPPTTPEATARQEGLTDFLELIA